MTRWWSPDHRNQQPNPMTSRTRLRDVVLLMRYSSWAINRQEDEKKKKWPIIMLIGDYHRSVMCTWRHRSRLLVTMIMPFVSSHLVISIGVGIHRRFLQELLRQCYAGNNWFAIYHSQEVPVNGILEKNNWITISYWHAVCCSSALFNFSFNRQRWKSVCDSLMWWCKRFLIKQ